MTELSPADDNTLLQQGEVFDPLTADAAQAAQRMLGEGQPGTTLLTFSDQGGPYAPGEASRTIPSKQMPEVAASAAEQRTEHLENELSNLKLKNIELAKHLEARTADLRASEEGAARDPQTGLWNKAAFPEIVEPKAARYGGVLLMLDIDYFKQVNDQLGHDVGDHVLNELATVLKENTRPEDVACRFGGEEFCVYVQGDHVTSTGIATRLQHLINKIEFPGSQSITIKDPGSDTTHTRNTVGISIGMADYSSGKQFAEVFKSADDALYAAKHSGRNQIVPDWEIQQRVGNISS